MRAGARSDGGRHDACRRCLRVSFGAAVGLAPRHQARLRAAAFARCCTRACRRADRRASKRARARDACARARARMLDRLRVFWLREAWSARACLNTRAQSRPRHAAFYEKAASESAQKHLPSSSLRSPSAPSAPLPPPSQSTFVSGTQLIAPAAFVVVAIAVAAVAAAAAIAL